MFEIIKNILCAILGISGFVWQFSNSPWQDLAKIYQIEKKIPDTFAIAQNQRIILKRENNRGSLALTGLGIGVSDEGLYLSSDSFPLFSDKFFPALLIPWSDVAYRKKASRNSVAGYYYTFYLGNPIIANFWVNSETIEKLERDYGEPIFFNKLGEAD